MKDTLSLLELRSRRHKRPSFPPSGCLVDSSQLRGKLNQQGVSGSSCSVGSQVTINQNQEIPSISGHTINRFNNNFTQAKTFPSENRSNTGLFEVSLAPSVIALLRALLVVANQWFCVHTRRPVKYLRLWRSSTQGTRLFRRDMSARSLYLMSQKAVTGTGTHLTQKVYFPQRFGQEVAENLCSRNQKLRWLKGSR